MLTKQDPPSVASFHTARQDRSPVLLFRQTIAADDNEGLLKRQMEGRAPVSPHALIRKGAGGDFSDFSEREESEYRTIKILLILLILSKK